MTERERSRIRLYAGCRRCAPQKPANQSMESWQRIQCGLTDEGFQVWCSRCRIPIVTFTPDELRAQLHSAHCSNPDCAECREQN